MGMGKKAILLVSRFVKRYIIHRIQNQNHPSIKKLNEAQEIYTELKSKISV